MTAFGGGKARRNPQISALEGRVAIGRARSKPQTSALEGRVFTALIRAVAVIGWRLGDFCYSIWRFAIFNGLFNNYMKKFYVGCLFFCLVVLMFLCCLDV